jgi:hypothetical protein
MRAAVRSTLQKGAAHLLRAGIDAVQVMKTHAPTQIQFWFIALAIGIAAGVGSGAVPAGDFSDPIRRLWHP